MRHKFKKKKKKNLAKTANLKLESHPANPGLQHKSIKCYRRALRVSSISTARGTERCYDCKQEADSCEWWGDSKEEKRKKNLPLSISDGRVLRPKRRSVTRDGAGIKSSGAATSDITTFSDSPTVEEFQTDCGSLVETSQKKEKSNKF